MTNFRIRAAAETDCDKLQELIEELGYEAGAFLHSNLKLMIGRSFAPLVAQTDDVIGCVTYNVTPVLHRPRPVGRLTLLTVAAAWRGQGVGRALVAAAVEALRSEGCGLCEVTSNLSRSDAHAFYERLGFERTSYRFARNI